MNDRPQLRWLADRAGILPAYLDTSGIEQTTKDSTRVALLAAMGFDVSTEAAASQTLVRLERAEQACLVPPVRVVRADARQLTRVRLDIPGDRAQPVDWHVELQEEGGAVHSVEGRSKPRERDGAVFVSLPVPPPTGYHKLHATVERPGDYLEAEQSFIVSPGRCTTVEERLQRFAFPGSDDSATSPLSKGGYRGVMQPTIRESALGSRQAFGVWTNLYTVRSKRNWGVGDLADVEELARLAGPLGAAFVGLNPLHALRNVPGYTCPYCPVSRLFQNLLYLDIESIPEFADCEEARRRVESAEFQTELAACREAEHIGYERVAALKEDVLRLLHASFVELHGDRNTNRGRAYREFVARRGKVLTDYATFMALEARFGRNSTSVQDWRDWPAGYHMPDAPEVETFRAAHRHEIDFHCYVQFELDRQLASTQEEARRAGLSLGLYHDLAIGSAADGSDAWAFGDLFVKGVQVGAPPDPYSATGQTWGFPPVDPRRLTASRYRYWIELLRSNLAHAGMLRIDHVMGLFRQFWVPDDVPDSDGAYVRYPADDLLGILALESQRHGTVIVGEDLGTVPRGLPATLARWGILSSRVMYFERSRRGSFRPAASYSKRALATATTHDHPPLAGFWRGRDLEIRREVGLLAGEKEFADAQKERTRTWAALLRRLVADGLLSKAKSCSAEDVIRAVHLFLARTPCPLLGISLDDLAGETEPVNLPGVELSQYSSWSRRMGKDVESIFTDEAVQGLLKELAGPLVDD